MSSPHLPSTDLYRIDELLTDEERLVQETIRRFVNDEFLPIVQEHFQHGTFPQELIRPLGKLGLLGMHLSEYGCAGASAMAYGVACEELEAGDSGLRSFVSVQGSLAMFPIATYGSSEQRAQWLPEMAQGNIIGCFGLTEPDAGSDPGSMQTTARRDGKDWILNGTKMWITNATIADLAVVWARTEDKGIRGFIVERGMRGLSTPSVPEKLSLRASSTGAIIMDDVRVGPESILPLAHGLRAPLSCLSEARYGIAWGVLGAARSCFECAREYSLSRTVFGSPLASKQLTQEKLADMATQLIQGRLLAHRLGTLKDDGEVEPFQVSLAKRANVRAAINIARQARTILGANGITLEYPVFRHMVNLESVLTYEGTEEVHTLILGNTLTGTSAFGS